MVTEAPDLLAMATPREVLLLASRMLVAVGADMATSQICDGPSTLLLVGFDGFDEQFFDFFAVVSQERTSCMAAAKQQRPIMVADVATDPTFADSEFADILLRSGSTACLSYPLLDDSGHVVGVISAHWRQKGERDATPVWRVADETSRRLVSALGGSYAAAKVDGVADVENLRRALSSRSVIAQAQGILMARQKTSASEAFKMLSQASQRTNRKLRDIATELVEGYESNVR